MLNEEAPLFANSGASSLSKVSIESNSVFETVEVGNGPQNLIEHEGKIYVSRTFYDENWNAIHGSSKIDNGEVTINNYGTGVVCGGSVLSFNGSVYRSFSGGISPLNEDLSLNESADSFKLKSSLRGDIPPENDL